jgi:hypothetical protein
LRIVFSRSAVSSACGLTTVCELLADATGMAVSPRHRRAMLTRG